MELPPKAFRVLECLVEHRPNALSHQQLKEAAWPRTFVGYTSLSKAIHQIRRAVGDDPRKPRCVRTVSRLGYAFAGDAREEPAPGALPPSRFSLRWRAHELELLEGESLLGRDPHCAARIPSLSVSRRHARIVVSGDRALLEDLGSKNGTRLNGRRVTGPTVVSDGDEILVGKEAVVFNALAPAGTTRTDRLPRVRE